MKIAGKEIRKSHFVAVVALGVTVFAVVFATISSKNAKNAGPAGMGAGARRMRGGGNTVVSVKTMELAVTTLHGYVSTNGEVESQNSVSVFPDMGGKVISTNVVLGSVVKKGDIIAYVDPSEPGSSYRSSPVYAPISGSIISTPLKNGTKVTTSTAVATIGDIKNLQVTANVPERYVSVLKTGLKANVKVEAYPDVVFEATVSRVSPVVDSTSRTKEVVLTFDKIDPRVNAGMFAKVILYTEDYTDCVVMPVDALVQNGDDYYAYIVNDDSTVKKQKVTLGKSVDGVVQITSGLESGLRVVTQGQTSLAEGSKILDITNGVQQSNEKEKSFGSKRKGE